MHFAYKALDPSGALVDGTLEAASRAAAAHEIASRRLVAVDLRERASSPRAWLSVSLLRRPRLTSRDVVTLTQGMASLLKAGLTLDRALSILASTSDRAAIRNMCMDLHRRVREGETFADALLRHARMFPPYFITMVRSGEIGGTLHEGLEHLALFMERAARVRERVVSALIYPAILAGMILVTIVLVLTVILPRFEALFAESRAPLPWVTQIVMGLGIFVRNYGFYCSAAATIACLMIYRALQDPIRAEALDRRLVTSRWTFGLITKTQSSRFLRTLGTLAHSGVPLPQATGVALGMLQNRALASAGQEIHQRLKEGQSLSALFEQAKVFPSVAAQLSRVGEETGRLHELLIEVADVLDRETQTTIEGLLSTLVPGITILMGALVATLIGSVLVGILSLNDLAF